jgi:hypothetical protein
VRPQLLSSSPSLPSLYPSEWSPRPTAPDSVSLPLRKGSRGGPSRRGVALLRPEPLHRGTADTFLNRVKKLPCQITR